MSVPDLKYCPGTLAEGYDAYSPAFLRRMFQGKKVSHILPYEAPQNSEADAEKFLENRKRISISGVQENYPCCWKKNQLRLTEEGEPGTFILKPIPRDLKKVDADRAKKLLKPFLTKQEKVEVLTKKSFLNEVTKRAYLLDYNTQRNRLVQT